jgi:arginine deiminase
MMISKDLALIQIGTRSNIQGAKYLMDNNLLGTRRFGVVKDEKDRNQQRMHLDTIVNIIDDKNIIMLDFDDPALPKNARRDVDIYEQV